MHSTQHVETTRPDTTAPASDPAASSVATRATDPRENPAKVYLSGLAHGSHWGMINALETIAAYLSDGELTAEAFPCWTVRFQDAAAVRTYLVERYAPKTVNRMLAGFRGGMKTTWRLGFMDAETYQRAVDIDNVRGHALPRGRALEDDELAALFQCCAEDRSPAGRRDASLLAVLFVTGMRRAELAGLDIGDFDPVDCSLTIRNGKRRTQRVVYHTDRACALIREWLQIRGSEPGPLFVPINKKGDVRIKRLGGESIRYIVQRRQKQAGVAEFSPHDARRTVLTSMLDKGVDVSTVQRVAGHADVSTTTVYDRRGEAAKRRAAQALQIP